MQTFEEYRDLVERRLTDFLVEAEPEAEKINEAMRYSLEAGGKRIRPVLLLASCEAAGGSAEQAMPFACAMEYIHTYSLIHDDLPAMDDDELRRGKPTNHVIYGAGIATLAGDGLLNAAYEAMLDACAKQAGDPRALVRCVRAASAIARGAGVRGMVGGQTADIRADSGEHSEPLLEYIHENKTAAMIVGAVRAGLFLGGADPDWTKAMTTYAENLGLAFQAADDILDETKTSEELGKPAGSDEKNHKLTVVTLYGIDGARKRLSDLTDSAVRAVEGLDCAPFFIELVTKLEKRTY